MRAVGADSLPPTAAADLVVGRESISTVLKPVYWLVLGLLVSYAYLYGPAFMASSITASAQLPVPLFPSQAVILSVLLLTARRWWWLYLSVYYGIQVTQGLWYGLALPYTLVSNVANVIEPLVGAWMLSRLIDLPPRFARLQEVGIYVGCVVTGSVLGATWGAAARAAQGFPFWSSWPGWFLADVLASLILAPTIVLWFSARRDSLPQTRGRKLEAAALLLTLLVVGVMAFGTRILDPETAPALLYLPIPALLWAAVRFGPRGVLTALSLTTVLAIVGAADDLGTFLGRSPEANLLTIQVFLLGVGVPFLCLAALVQERHQAQTNLQQSEQRYRAVVSNIPHAIVLLFGSDMRHLFADGQGLEDMDLSAAAVEGKTAWQAFPLEIASTLGPRYAAALAGTESSVEITYQARTFDAQVLPVQYAGSRVGMVIVQEITEQRRAEVLAELDRTRTVFFSDVSHEFRTPLTLLLGSIEEGIQFAESPTQRERLELAERNAQRLLKLTNALLDFARIEAGRIDPAYESLDLSALTSELASAFRSAIELAGLRLVVECPPLPAGMEVYVDRDLWEKVVLNLLSNALKFTFDGGIIVSLHASRDSSTVELRVRDTGVGVPASELPRLFERFYRVRDQRSRAQEGSGIGLALVQELVKLHGGTIAATSQVGFGTEFLVTIPTGRAHLAAEHLRSAQPREPASVAARAFVQEALGWSGTPDAPVTQPGLAVRHAEASARILVVDDNTDVRAYLARLLSSEYDVEQAADGTSALRAIQADQPDLVISDVMLPGLNGLDLVQAIRADPLTQAIPVVLLSARAGEEARVDGLRAGADDYLVKPFAARELLARIGAHLALQKQRQRLLDLERSARNEAERARQAAERASSRALSISAVTSALASATTLQEVGDAVMHEALPVVRATSGTLLLRTDNPDLLAMVAPTGYERAVESQYLHIPQAASLPGAEVVRTGEALWIESVESVASQFPFWAARPTGNKALAALPLTVHGDTLGSLIVGFASERSFDPDDQAFLLTMAGQCAIAVNRVQLHTAAENARHAAEVALRSRDDFLRTLAHDLKTPLTALVWHVQLLRHDNPNDANGHVAAAEMSARELISDIDELRDLVRHQQGDTRILQRERIDLVALVGEAVSSTNDSDAHQIRVLTEESVLPIEGDRGRLKRALCNLLDNAFKYSARGTEVLVSLRTVEQADQTWSVIEVTDHGVGIPGADLPFVFNRYHRGANVADVSAGEGIGLESARQLVEWHSGRLTVQSVEGSGSSFTIWLPAVRGA